MASMFTNPYDAQIDQEAARRKEMREVAKMDAFDANAYRAGMAGQEIGRNLGGMMGMQTPEDAKQAKIQEIMGQYGEGAKTVKQLQDIAGDFGNAGMMDLMQETLSMIDKIEPKQTTASFNLSKLQDSLAYLESVSGETFTDIEKKQWLARTKNTVTVTDSGGQVDSGKTNFNAILDDRGNKKKNDFRFADTEITGATQKKDLAIFDTKVTRMSKDMSKASNAESTLSRLEEGMSKYKNPNGTWKDIPGFSNLEQFTRSAEGDELSAMWENVIGELRKERFGSVLTPSEQKSFDKIKTGNFFFLPDEAVIKFVEDLRAKIDSEKNKVSAGYSDDVVAEYNSRLFKQNAKIESGKLQAQIQKAKDSGYSDAQISEFIKMKQGGK